MLFMSLFPASTEFMCDDREGSAGQYRYLADAYTPQKNTGLSKESLYVFKMFDTKNTNSTSSLRRLIQLASLQAILLLRSANRILSFKQHSRAGSMGSRGGRLVRARPKKEEAKLIFMLWEVGSLMGGRACAILWA